MTKNGEPRRVPLSPVALECLRQIQDARQRPPEGLAGASCGLVFSILANVFRLAWERVKHRAGISDLRFHDLRHEAISRFFEMGLSVPEVALISGHKDTRMLFRYTHLRAEEVAKKLG
jgi:integrase